MVHGWVNDRPHKFKLSEDMIDLRDADHVEVEKQGSRLYVHVDGVTVLRIYGVKNMVYTQR